MSSIYLNKKQLSILSIGLMSLTRDDKAFEYGIKNGAFKEDDIYDYIETLREFLVKVEDCNGALLTTETNFDDVDQDDCLDLWGIPLNS